METPTQGSLSNTRRRASDSGPAAAMDARRSAMEAQAVADAKLHSFFDATGGAQGGFDYSATVEALKASPSTSAEASPNNSGPMSRIGNARTSSPSPLGQVSKVDGALATAYLQKMQRGGLIQSFGCVLVLEESTFNVLAYSENAPEMLGLLDSEQDTSAEVGRKGVDDSLKRGNSMGAALLHIGARIRRVLVPKPGEKGARMSDLANAPRHQRGPSTSAPAPGALTKAASTRQPRAHDPRTDQESLPLKERETPPRAPLPKGLRKRRLDLGVCALPFFTADSAANLKQAVESPDLRVLNPLLVQSVGATGEVKPFFAIIHRNDAGLHVDLEPIREEDAVFATGQGAMQAHRLAARAVSRLEKVPAGNLPMLFDAAVQEVRALTGYDRVIAYKFHEDEHGEVLAEARKETMDPFLGLHYPATDIPQAARILFMKTKVRIIVDFAASNVKVRQDEAKVRQPVALANSTLRAVHGCHAEYMKNMNTQGSTSMAVIVNEHPSLSHLPPALPGQEPGRRLWGLVVCHHETARFLPYPLRQACEFLMQVFSLRVNMEMEMEVLEKQKDALRVQAYLTDMLLRDPLHAIVTRKPSIADLFPCDGAALLLQGTFFPLGNTPTQPQMMDMLQWHLSCNATANASSVFWAESLRDAGYPYADALRDVACGVMMAPFGDGPLRGGCIYWFRSPVEKWTKWSGAKQEAGERDDGSKMNPRSSFKAFLEVVRDKAPAWDDLAKGAASSLITFLSGYRMPPQILNATPLPQQPSPLDYAQMSMSQMSMSQMSMSAWSGLRQNGSNTSSPALMPSSERTEEELQVEILDPAVARLRKAPSKSPSGPLSLSLESETSLPDSLPFEKASAGSDCDASPPKAHSQGSSTSRTSSSPEFPLRKALAAAQTPVMTADRHGRVTSWGAKMTHLTGLSEGDALGQSLVQHLLEDGSTQDFSSTLASVLQGSESQEVELRFRCFSGRTGSGALLPRHTKGTPDDVILLMHAHPLVAEGGVMEGEGGLVRAGAEVIGVHFIGEDMTQMKVLEEEMKRTQGDYASVVHSQSALIPPIFGINEAGQCMEWNHAMEALTGVRKGEALGLLLVGQIFSGRLPMLGENKLRLLVGVAQGLGGVPVDRHPFAFQNAEGEEMEVLLTVKTRRDPTTDEVTGCLGFLHCPSAELKQALAIQRAAENLARASTRQVQYLRDQIRAPLDGLKHVREQMKDLPMISEETRKALDTGVRCEQQLTRILGDDIGALEEGYLGLESDEFSLLDTVNVVVSIAQQVSAKRGVDFKWETSLDLANAPQIVGDAVRLQQALADLLTSAISHTPGGGLVLLRGIMGELKTGEDGEGFGCEFRVVHSNPDAIPSPILDCIRGVKRDEAGINGEGLALRIARRIIEEMNGDVKYHKMTGSGEIVVRLQCKMLTDLEVDVL